MSDNAQQIDSNSHPEAPRAPASAVVRRRAADSRHRAAGRVRLHAWLPSERLTDIDALMRTWGIDDRAEVVDVALRFLLKFGQSMQTLEL